MKDDGRETQGIENCANCMRLDEGQWIGDGGCGDVFKQCNAGCETKDGG